MTGFRNFAKPRLGAMLLLSMLLALTSTTGCQPRYVVVRGTETVSVKKATLDELYSDNEHLLQALKECREGSR
jgi:cell division septal protein FtsQ